MTRAGYVYVMVSSSRDRLIKIGGTKNHPNERARDLNTTGVAFDLVVSYYEEVSDWELVEKLLHTHFDSQRSNPNREFFGVEPRDAIERLQKFAAMYPVEQQLPDEQSDNKTSTSDDPITPEKTDTTDERALGLKAFYEAQDRKRKEREKIQKEQDEKWKLGPSPWMHVQCSYCTCRYAVNSESSKVARCPVCQRDAHGRF